MNLRTPCTLHVLSETITYKTKLKLDKEVGGGVLRNVGIAND